MRLDEVQHLASKEKAELTWRQRNAAEVNCLHLPALKHSVQSSKLNF